MLGFEPPAPERGTKTIASSRKKDKRGREGLWETWVKFLLFIEAIPGGISARFYFFFFHDSDKGALGMKMW